MQTEQINIVEIYMEGDSVTTVETHIVVESIALWPADVEPEFTPMFAPMYRPDYAETQIIASPVFEQFRAPIIRNIHGRQTWLC